jgi:hypothetical protein
LLWRGGEVNRVLKETKMRNHRNALFSLIAVLAVGLLGVPELADAKRKRRNRVIEEEVSQFAVEFTCGTNDSSFEMVVPGDYASVVNVYNAGGETRARAMVSLSFPVSSNSAWRQTTFAPRQSRQLDCADIVGGGFVFREPLDEDGYYQGFVIIQTRGALDVVARYTAAGDDGEVTTDVETVDARRVRRPPIDENALVTICHVPPGNPDNAHTIQVEPDSVSAHIAHGDYEGACIDDDDDDDDDD